MNFLNNKYVILFILYLFSNIFTLLNIEGIYWDDWTLIYVSNSELSNHFFQASGYAGVMIAYLHSFLLDVGNGVYIYRILTFIIYFAISILFFKILTTIKQLNKIDVFCLTLLFMLVPLNPAKIALINFPYTLSLLLFFVGLYLVTINASQNNYLLRFATLILFFLSFVTNSLLVFYVLVIIYMYYIQYFNLKISITNKIKKFIIRHIDFLFLPLIFFIIKILYFHSSGIFAEYNVLNSESLIKIPVISLYSFYSSLIQPINNSFYLLLYFWPILLPLLSIKKLNTSYFSANNTTAFLFVGFVLFILAVFPYAAVGKTPDLVGFESRHQLLIPAGLAFIIYFTIAILSRKYKTIVNKLFVVFIIAFIVQNIYNGYKLKLDWFYQTSIDQQFLHNSVIKNNTTFIAHMNLKNHLFNSRSVRFYESNNRLKKIFKNDKRLMVNDNQDIEDIIKYRDSNLYGFKSWIYSKPINVFISGKDVSFTHILKMFVYEFIDKQKFKKLSLSLTNLQTKN